MTLKYNIIKVIYLNFVNLRWVYVYEREMKFAYTKLHHSIQFRDIKEYFTYCISIKKTKKKFFLNGFHLHQIHNYDTIQTKGM